MLTIIVKRIFIYLSLIGFLSSVACKKDVTLPIVPDNKGKVWLVDSSFSMAYKIVLNSHTINDSSLVTANNEYTRIINGANSYYTSGGVKAYDPPFYYSLGSAFSNMTGNSVYVRPYLSKSLIVTPYRRGVYIASCLAPTKGYADLKSPMPDVTEQLGFGFIGYLWDAISFVGDNTFIYSYGYKKDTDESDILLSYLTRVQIDMSFPQVSKLDTIPLNIKLGKNIIINGARPFFYSFFDNLFLVIGAKIYRIDADGKYMDVTTPANGFTYVNTMFAIGNTLFAIGAGQNNSIVVSTDKGITWNVFSTGNPDLSKLVSLRYLYVGGKTIAIYNSQMFLFTLNGNTLSYKEIDNTGLYSNYITSISQAGKQIFVTTMSGVYYKDTTNFITFKQ